MAQLKDKVALILGASTQGGIGAATARRFVADGAQVIVSARRQEALEAVASEVGAVAMTCDITDERQVEALIGAAFGYRNRLDVLVIVAGGYASQPVDQLTRDTLLATFELNVIGPGMLIKHAARVMDRGASIIYVSSAAADLSSFGVAPYACTKAAGERLVEVAALEYAATRNSRQHSAARDARHVDVERGAQAARRAAGLRARNRARPSCRRH